LKIITWNVNGLRAAMKKGIWDWVESQDADVVCLQEIKARPEQLDEDHRQRFAGLHAYWNPAQRPGYSGVVTFTRTPPLEVYLGMGDERFDDEGRVVRTRYTDFWLYNIYFPNGQRGHERLTYKLDFYARLLEICDQLHQVGQKVVLCGDFNTAHQEIDLRYPKANATTSGFMPEERIWIDHYIDHHLVDIYRQLYPERVQYTWWTYRLNARTRGIGWRLDYFMLSEPIASRVEDVTIHDEVPGSDHCPVSLTFC
jgi:exodeoxyribonuclease-3